MALNVRSTRWLRLPQFVSVLLYLCVFSCLPFSQLAVLAWVESVETECPCRENEESSEKARCVYSSARRRTNVQRHSDLSWPLETGDRPFTSALFAGGHQLADGFRAPLLI